MSDTPQHTGIMVALMIPANKADGLVVAPDALPKGSTPTDAADLHITLGYFGDTTDTEFAQEDLTTAIGAFARYATQVKGEVNGIGRFLTDAGSDTNAFYASFDSPTITRFRQSLLSELAAVGISPDTTHGFTPHITLAYIPTDAPTPTVALQATALSFDTVTLAWGDVRTDFALSGMADYSPYTIYSAGPSRIKSVAEFTNVGVVTDADTWVERTGLIFRAGDYPDKDFSITSDELHAAAAAFAPVPLDVEHMPSVFDGKLGELARVDVRNGSELWGTARFPRWLDGVLADSERKVSCTWDRATKTLQKLALVRNPRVPDAVLMAAFSAAQEQPMTDTQKTDPVAALDTAIAGLAQFAGAALNADNKKRVQTIHDTVQTMGAACSAKMSGEPEMTPREKALADRLAAQEANFAQVQQERRHEQGEAFAKDYADRLTPHARGIVADFYAMFAEADAAGKATFSGGAQKTRVAAFTEFLATLAPLPYTREQIAGFSAVPHSGEGAKSEVAEFDEATKAWALKMNGGK